MYSGGTPSWRTARSCRTITPGATAPIASSGLSGARSFRGITTSSGARSERATGSATATPPRGIARTVAGPDTRFAITSASAAPASSRFRNTLPIIAPALLRVPAPD